MARQITTKGNGFKLMMMMSMMMGMMMMVMILIMMMLITMMMARMCLVAMCLVNLTYSPPRVGRKRPCKAKLL